MWRARWLIPTRFSACSTRRRRSCGGMPRYVSGSSTFSNTVRSPIRLKLWKMNPISRLRTRARSEAGSSATGRPFSRYCPSVGESSKPRMDSSVDLPQPDGPAIDTYSPLSIWRWMPDNACVSTSSVKNTFVTPSSLMSACPVSAISFSCRASPTLFQPDAIVCVVCRHIGQDHLIADLESLQHFDRVDRAPAKLHLHALGVHAVGGHLEEADDALILAEGGPAHEEDVVQPLELDRAVDAQIRHRTARQVADERDVDGPRAILHRRIDAGDAPLHDAVARVDFRLLPELNVLRLRFRDLD